MSSTTLVLLVTFVSSITSVLPLWCCFPSCCYPSLWCRWPPCYCWPPWCNPPLRCCPPHLGVTLHLVIVHLLHVIDHLGVTHHVSVALLPNSKYIPTLITPKYIPSRVTHTKRPKRNTFGPVWSFPSFTFRSSSCCSSSRRNSFFLDLGLTDFSQWKGFIIVDVERSMVGFKLDKSLLVCTLGRHWRRVYHCEHRGCSLVVITVLGVSTPLHSNILLRSS